MWDDILGTEVRALLNRKQRLEAIKLVYGTLGLKSLSEARQVVNDFEEYMRLQTPELALMPPLNDDLEDEVRQMLPEQKIGAIKMIREATGYGLKEAKDAVEDIQYNRTPWPDNLSWFTWVEVRNLMKSAENKAVAMKLIRDEVGVETAVAFKLCEAIKEGKITEPPPPPKYRSIDDE